jgi:hypothetical protein
MLGKLAVCEASEREIWTTNDYFKVAVPGYNAGYDKMNFPPETRSSKFCLYPSTEWTSVKVSLLQLLT